jgi:hypothetical protein
MRLQQQLSLDAFNDTIDHEFCGRLSRIVSKLFARVLRAEETSDDPYATGHFDVCLLLRTMESVLIRCQEVESDFIGEQLEQVSACRKMVTDFIYSFLENYQGEKSLNKYFREIGLDMKTSLLSDVIALCEKEFDLTDESAVVREIKVERRPTNVSPLSTTQSMGPAKDVGTMIQQISDKTDDTYDFTHRESHASPKLSSFTHEALNEVESSRHRVPIGSNRTDVSERLRQLRSRLQATEMSAQSEGSPSDRKNSESNVLSMPRQSRLSAPSPSRISQSIPSRPRSIVDSNVSTILSLRDRLAASQDTRQPLAETTSTSSSMSRAAALRARLEAVKQQGNHH